MCLCLRVCVCVSQSVCQCVSPSLKFNYASNVGAGWIRRAWKYLPQNGLTGTEVTLTHTRKHTHNSHDPLNIEKILIFISQQVEVSYQQMSCHALYEREQRGEEHQTCLCLITNSAVFLIQVYWRMPRYISHAIKIILFLGVIYLLIFDLFIIKEEKVNGLHSQSAWPSSHYTCTSVRGAVNICALLFCAWTYLLPTLLHHWLAFIECIMHPAPDLRRRIWLTDKLNLNQYHFFCCCQWYVAIPWMLFLSHNWHAFEQLVWSCSQLAVLCIGS